MAGRRGRPERDPLDELDPVAALARQLERVQRVQATQEELLRGLAADVAALVAQAPTQTPTPPASWLTAGDPGDALELLRGLVLWVGEVYLWYPGARLPTCWLWHPALVEELCWLCQYHREAYTAPTRSAGKAAEFHERFLPRRDQAPVGEAIQRLRPGAPSGAR